MINIEKLKAAGIVSIRDELLKLQSGGAKISRTESGDPSFDIPVELKAEIYNAIAEGKTHYTSSNGVIELRKAIVEKLANENGIRANVDDIFITSGAMNGLYVLFQSLVEIHGRFNILMPTPTWTETCTNSELAGCNSVYYDAQIDLANIEDMFNKSKAKAIVINSPHNPTGLVLSKEVLEGLVNICKKNNAYLISDEAYEHIIYDGNIHVSPDSLIEYDKIISVFSCSKSYAMSGLRVGYCVVKDDCIKASMSKFIRCTVNGVNSISQYGLVNVINNINPYIKDMVNEYDFRRKMLFDAITGCSFLNPIMPKGAFYIWAKITNNMDDWDVTAKLIEYGVGSAPGSCFGPGGKGWIRFSFSCPTSHISIASEILNGL